MRPREIAIIISFCMLHVRECTIAQLPNIAFAGQYLQPDIHNMSPAGHEVAVSRTCREGELQQFAPSLRVVSYRGTAAARESIWKMQVTKSYRHGFTLCSGSLAEIHERRQRIA